MSHAGPNAASTSAGMRWAFAAWLFALVGCGSTDSPCYGVAVGNHLSLELVDTYDVNSEMQWAGFTGSTATCGFGFDVARGQVLEATIASSFTGDNAGCRVGSPDFPDFSDWDWARKTNVAMEPFGGTLLQGSYSATRGACNGDLELIARVTDGADPFAPSVPGSVPNVILSRVFTGPGTADCGTCFGYFVVNVQRQ